MSLLATPGEVPPMAEGGHEAHRFARGSPCVHREIPRSRVTTAGVFGAVARLPRPADPGPWSWRCHNRGARPWSKGAKPPARHNSSAPARRSRAYDRSNRYNLISRRGSACDH